MSNETWANWSRSVEAHPRRIAHPASTSEVASLVKVARSEGLAVKAYGAMIRRLRGITNTSVNKEPKWRHNGHELTTGYNPLYPRS